MINTSFHSAGRDQFSDKTTVWVIECKVAWAKTLQAGTSLAANDSPAFQEHWMRGKIKEGNTSGLTPNQTPDGKPFGTA